MQAQPKLEKRFDAGNCVQMKIVPSYRVVTDRFFREQWEGKRQLRARIDEIWEQDWKADSPYRGDPRAKFVADYKAALEAAACFGFATSGDISRTRLGATHKFNLCSNLLLPVSIAQRIDIAAAPYVEEMVMLTRAGVQIGGKKVAAHQAPLCFLLSRHFLERLFDRGAIGADMGAHLKANTMAIARKLAFALSVGLAKTEFGEDGGQSAFVPYRDGLIIFVSKILAGRTFDENLGWKFDFARKKYVPLYVKKDLVKELARSAEARAEQKMFVQSWYAATFVAGSMLSRAQRKFVTDFEAVYGAIDDANIDNSFDLWFNPDFVFRQDKRIGFEITPELANAFDQVEQSLGNDALKVHGKHPIMYLAPDGAKTDQFNGAQK